MSVVSIFNLKPLNKFQSYNLNVETGGKNIYLSLQPEILGNKINKNFKKSQSFQLRYFRI